MQLAVYERLSIAGKLIANAKPEDLSAFTKLLPSWLRQRGP